MIDLKTINKLDEKKVGFFRFKQFDNNTYLLTNDVGKYVFINEKDFKNFITGKLIPKDKIHKELKDNLFIKDQDYQSKLIESFREKNSFLKFGPS